MSHMTMQKTALDDAEAIKASCLDMHLKIRENAKPTYYSGRKGDVVCDYVISLPGTDYEVGLKYNAMTQSFDLYYDKWNGYVENVLGQGCSKLIQSAAFHKILGDAQLRGYTMEAPPEVETKTGELLFEIDHY